jgi:kynurenine formamidase
MAKKVRIIDLSLEIKEGLGRVSLEGLEPQQRQFWEGLAAALTAKISHYDHKASIPAMLRAFPGVPQEALPDGLAWADDYLTLSVHAGTHMDAPWHFHPTTEGKRAKTIDEFPLEWGYSNGVVLDMTHKKAGELITVANIQEALKKMKYQLKPLDIVLIRTDTDKLWDTMQYWTDYAGMGREATIWLIDQGVKVVGTDAPGWDRPFRYQAAEYRKTQDKSVIWEGHYAGIEREYYQMEKLAHLDRLPAHGFKLCCFPVKILKASAAWIRPVAIVEE